MVIHVERDRTVTIPASVTDMLGITAGAALSCSVSDGAIHLAPVSKMEKKGG
ncbi:AbrB/MazE/SpoVT family DNA-binding domain-containing protein [Eubacteriales bacterium OttesenSCG-928-K08]|nr:AbrB/MazE/SpoVT family DNA-binding domain-containing protein [Eubacteriales bacterium OttesenSCG-928-K08]